MVRTLISESANSRIDPLRVIIARRRRGLKKTELARTLGVTPRTISRYEQGMINESVLTSLADVLDFPARFFYRNVAFTDNVQSARFRSRKRAPQTTKDMATAFGLMGAEIDIYINERFTLPQLSLPNLSELTPEHAARELRYHWAIEPERPLPNLIQLCESKGVHVYGLPAVAAHIDAFSDWYNGNPLVFLAQQKTPERSRFDLAHELGHLVMHHQGSVDSAAQEEKEADLFAAEFLLPSSVLRQNMHNNPSIETILKYRTSFQLSAMAVTMAARRAGKLNDHAFDNRVRFLSRRGYRTGEPGGLGRYEASRIFPTVFNRSHAKHLTVEQVCRDLAFPLVDVHALTFGSQMVSIAGLRPAAPSSPRGTGHLHAV